jgi:hypothetical protein
MKCLIIPILLTVILGSSVNAQEAVSLFDGKTLKGWNVMKCEAEVVDGAILIKSGNGVLASEKQYGDFVLECDWKQLHTNMWDSGIYFRCELPGEKVAWPKKHQVNLRKGQEGAITGADKTKAASLFKKDEWNHFKLTVKGKTAELEFNGEKAWSCDKIEPATGYLCLQAEVPQGGQFVFKNITIKELDVKKETPVAK